MAPLRLKPYLALALALQASLFAAAENPRPYSPPCVEREEVFEFTEPPVCRRLGEDRYEISFGVKGNCDVTVAIEDNEGKVVRHLGSGVLGAHAPLPFQKNSLRQKLIWNGKDDLDSYHKAPQSLKVRVMLGLKPVFDKRLGGTSPKNLPGNVTGIAIGPDGAYIFCKGGNEFGHATIRKFNSDGDYLGTIFPPPANLPEAKLDGMGYVEYQPGTRTVHGPDLGSSFSAGSHYFPRFSLDVHVWSCAPALAGNRLVFPNAGAVFQSPGSFLHYLYTDGATDFRGLDGLRLTSGPQGKGVEHQNARLSVSPDEETVYLSAASAKSAPCTAVWARRLDEAKDTPAKIFAGETGKPGSDNAHFGDASSVDCDPQGRVYVADTVNNRIQVFTPDGNYLRTIPIERPDHVRIHRKSGAIYVQHSTRVQGASVARVTKLASFDEPKEVLHWDGAQGLLALDSWSERPRIWLPGRTAFSEGKGGSVTIWEERNGTFEKIADFQEEELREGAERWFGRWDGIGTLVMMNAMTFCDPAQEKAYHKSFVFDLKTGRCDGLWGSNSGPFDEIEFDKRGYLHGHQNCRARVPCVWRVDPRQAVKGRRTLSEPAKRGLSTGLVRACEALETAFYPECPYDYGVELAGGNGNWLGALQTRCQAGAKGFQDGMGVNMRGQIAVASNIYHVPKMGDLGRESAVGSQWKSGAMVPMEHGLYNEEGLAYERFLQSVKEAEKRGEEVYFIRRKPGIPLSNSTLWIFDHNGELRTQEPAVVGGLLNGLKLDEEGFVYFTMNRTRWLDGRRFLNGRSGRFGATGGRSAEDPNSAIFTGTFARAKPDRLTVLMNDAPIPMDVPPTRAPDVRGCGSGHSTGDRIWMDGAEWLYAGASPIVVNQPCSCYQLRAHLDWYKRSYVPEGYRHSIGILDANGNLILHLGRYANFDGVPGGKDGAKPGGEEIGMTSVRYLGGTDNYLAFEDWGEKLVVLRLDYQAQESVAVGK